ncbi:MAG: hypothetical protein WCJ75_15040 [Desulfomonile sp.]
MEVRASRASAVVVQTVPAAKADWFMEWQQGVTAAAEEFVGYRGVDVYPPGDDQRDEWVVVIHFVDETSLQGWLNSSVRAQWVGKLREQVGDSELNALPGGFGPWFAGFGRRPREAPPSEWKMALTVLFGLYPTVMLLTLLPGPYTRPLGLAFDMLIGNIICVCILQWGVMPALNVLVAPWLKADWEKQKARVVGGVIAILVALGAMATLFRQITG